jgi:hypothetical protein
VEQSSAKRRWLLCAGELTFNKKIKAATDRTIAALFSQAAWLSGA